MGGGPRVVSPAFDWHESNSGTGIGRVGPHGQAAGPTDRANSTGCLRRASASLAGRKGASTGVVFCSGRTLRARIELSTPAKAEAGDDRPVCCAAQTVHITVNATAKPVHFLLRSWVALGVAKCTDRG
jgi:hypothetical protein